MNNPRRKGDRALGPPNNGVHTQSETPSSLEKKYSALLSRYSQKTQELEAAEKGRDALFRVAYFDELTGLPNRRLLRESFDDAVKLKLPIVVLVIDLNKFKPINDTYGHNVGDDALKLVATTINSLASLTRETDIISHVPTRTGGDEFTIMFEGATLKDLEPKIEKIKKAFATQKLILGAEHGNAEIPVGASFGAYERKEGEPLEHCIKMADAEMYKEKKQFQNTIASYSWQHSGYHSIPSSIPNISAYTLQGFGIK